MALKHLLTNFGINFHIHSEKAANKRSFKIWEWKIANSNLSICCSHILKQAIEDCDIKYQNQEIRSPPPFWLTSLIFSRYLNLLNLSLPKVCGLSLLDLEHVSLLELHLWNDMNSLDLKLNAHDIDMYPTISRQSNQEMATQIASSLSAMSNPNTHLFDSLWPLRGKIKSLDADEKLTEACSKLTAV